MIKKIYFTLIAACLTTLILYSNDETTSTELYAFDHQENITPTLTPEIISVDRSGASVQEILKDIQDFNDYMTHLQQRQAAVCVQQYVEKHFEQIQQLEIIQQKLAMLMQHDIHAKTSIIHQSLLKSIQLAIEPITQSYQHSTLNISTFQKVTKILQSIVIQLEQHIIEKTEIIHSLDELSHIMPIIKDYSTCKEIIPDVFGIEYSSQLVGMSQKISEQLAIDSPIIQGIITKELREIQKLKTEQHNLIARQSTIIFNACIKQVPYMQNLNQNPFTFLADCLEKIISNSDTYTETIIKHDFITKCRLYTITRNEILQIAECLNTILYQDDASEQAEIHMIFRSENIQVIKQQVQRSITCLTSNFQLLQSIIKQVKDTQQYHSIETDFLSCREQIEQKENSLQNIESNLQQLQDSFNVAM